MHDIGLYDTGKDYRGYRSRMRNEGWITASVIAGAIMGVIGVVMFIVGLADPAAPFSVAVIGANLAGIPALNMLMFMTHRNFSLDDEETQVMDALYTLPKGKRKEYSINRKEVKLLTSREKNDLIEAVKEYRTSAPKKSGLIAMTRDLNDVNNEVKRIEGRR